MTYVDRESKTSAFNEQRRTSLEMDQAEAVHFVDRWVRGWNERDLEGVLSHFSDDVTFSSPVARTIRPDSAGVIRGKATLRDYWTEGLRRIPDLHFEILGIYLGVDALMINYRNQSADSSTKSWNLRAIWLCVVMPCISGVSPIRPEPRRTDCRCGPHGSGALKIEPWSHTVSKSKTASWDGLTRVAIDSLPNRCKEMEQGLSSANGRTTRGDDSGQVATYRWRDRNADHASSPSNRHRR